MQRILRLMLPFFVLVIGWGLFYPLTPVAHADPIVLSGEYNVVSARVSPDEQYIVYLTENPTRLISYGRQTSQSTILAYFPSEPESALFNITSDNQFVIFPTNVNGPVADIYRVPLDGSEPPTITVSIETHPGGLAYTITPDGQTIVYLEGNGSGQTNIYAKPITGGPSTPLDEGLANGEIYDFALSPSGNHVTYVLVGSDKSTQRIVIPVTGGTPTIVNPTGTSVYEFEATFAESANTLFFRVSTENDSRIYRVPLTGGSAVAVTPPSRSVYDDFQLSSDEQYLLYREFENGTHTLQRLTVSDNTIAPVTTIEGQGNTIFFNVAEEAPIAFIQSSVFVSPTYTATHSSAVFAPPSSAILLATLTGEGFPNAFAETQATRDGETLVIRQGAFNTQGSLYSVAGDGSADPVPLFAEAEVRDFFIADNQQEVFFQTRNATGATYYKTPIGGGTLTPLLQSAGKSTFINTVGTLSNGDVLLIDRNGEDDPRLDSLYLLEGVVTTEPDPVEIYLPLIRYEVAPPRD